MLPLFALGLFKPSALAVGDVDKQIVRIEYEEKLSLVASGQRNDQIRSGYFHNLKPLCDGENFRLAVGNQDRIFVVGCELAVGRHRGPAVLEDSYVVSALRDHRLHSDRHAFDHSRPSSGSAEIRYLRLFMHLLAYAVTYEGAHHTKPMLFNIRLDGMTDVGDPTSVTCLFDSLEKTLPSHRNELLCLG